MRRPLCVVCILVVSGILMYYSIHPFKTGLPEGIEEKEVILTGKVINKEKTIRGVRLTIAAKSLSLYVDINELEVMPEHEVCIGEVITVSGMLLAYESATNPGQFDLRKYYTLRGIDGYISAPVILGCNEAYDGIKEWLYDVRYKLAELFDKILPSQNAGIIKAMLLGLKQDMDADIKEQYQMNGIAHVLSISGLHIAVLGNGLYKLLKRSGAPEFCVMSTCLVAMLFYGLLTGTGSSVMRAIIMFSLRIIARLLHRSYDVLSATSLAALLILAENPLYLYDSGFLLSFGAVIGIVVVAPVFISVLPFKILTPFYMSLCIQLTTLPLCMYFFYEIPIYSVFLNLIVIPLMTPLLYIAIGGLILSLFSVPLGTVFCLPVRLIFVIYQGVCDFSDRLPYNSVITGKPEFYQCVIFYLFLALTVYVLPRIVRYPKKLIFEKQVNIKFVIARIIPVILMFVGLSVLLLRGRHCTSVYFLDVGQGDCIAVISKTGNCYLVDGGSSSKKNIASNIIIPFLKSNGISKVTACFISHPDTDHVNGIVDLLKDGKGIRVDTVYMAEYFEKQFSENKEEESALLSGGTEGLQAFYGQFKERIVWLAAGDKIVSGSDSFACFQVLHPACDYSADSDNDASLVLLYREENVFLMLTGDLEKNGEGCVEEYSDKLFSGSNYVNQEAANILKVGHHGSKYSSSEEFLMLIKPDVSIISCGENNNYGHPHEETLGRLSEVGSINYITAECGAIVLEIDDEIRVRTVKNN